MCWVLIFFNGGGNGLTRCANIHKFSFSPPILLVFPVDLLIDLFYLLPQGVEPHRSRLPSLSIRFSHHPAEVRHARVTPEGDLFLLLRRSTTTASRTDHYCSDGAPIVVGVPSSSASHHPSCDTWLLPLSLTAQTATSGKHHTIVSTHTIDLETE